MNDLQQRIGRIDELVGQIEGAAPEPVRESVRELVNVLLDVHGSGLESVLDALFVAGGQEAVDAVAEDELVGSLLLLHGLHPLRRDARVARALESVRPYLQSHGGDVELVEVTDGGTLRVRLEGSCDGCPSSSATLKYAIEEAVYKAAPDIVDIELLEPAPTDEVVAGTNGHDVDGFIPMSALTSNVDWDDCPFPSR